MSLRCKLFGHNMGDITGFTHDRDAVGRCVHCRTPIMTSDIKASEYLYFCYKVGFDSKKADDKYKQMFAEKKPDLADD